MRWLTLNMLTGVAGGKGQGNEISRCLPVVAISSRRREWCGGGASSRRFRLDAETESGKVPAPAVIIPAKELHAFLENHQANPHGWLGMHPLTHEGVAGVVVRAFVRAAVKCAVVELDGPGAPAQVEAAEAVFVGGGNSFRLLAEIYRLGLLEPLRARVLAGTPYIGSSAGTNLAGKTIGTTNDMPIVHPPSFVGLGLVPFNFNPHYLDPDPNSTHKGETRDARILEFHELNPQPVLALREPAMLRREGDRLTLRGAAGARLFRRGEDPRAPR